MRLHLVMILSKDCQLSRGTAKGSSLSWEGEKKRITMATRITTLLLDIGGVLLTNGWDCQARRRAEENFGLDYDEMDERHHLTFDTYEEGKLSLEDYLTRVIFYEKRPFSPEDFKTFMLAQS